LLLASRQRGGQCVAPPIEPELIEQRLRTLNGFPCVSFRLQSGDRRVFGGRQRRQQVELLETKPTFSRRNRIRWLAGKRQRLLPNNSTSPSLGSSSPVITDKRWSCHNRSGQQ